MNIRGALARPEMPIYRCNRKPGCATWLLLHQSTNVTSITRRCAIVAWPGDLIKSPIDHLTATVWRTSS